MTACRILIMACDSDNQLLYLTKISIYCYQHLTNYLYPTGI